MDLYLGSVQPHSARCGSAAKGMMGVRPQVIDMHLS
jgi:hypothetical protein